MLQQSRDESAQSAHINVLSTEDSDGYPTTIVENIGGDGAKLFVEFGRNGERYCSVISDKVSISSGDAVINGRTENPISINHGMPSEETLQLSSVKVGEISKILVQENSAAGYYNLLDRAETRSDVIEYMHGFGIYMTRAEQGVLAAQTDYVFRVGDGSEAYVNAGDRNYIKSEGQTTLSVTRGSVFLKTSVEGKQFDVVIDIK